MPLRSPGRRTGTRAPNENLDIVKTRRHGVRVATYQRKDDNAPDDTASSRFSSLWRHPGRLVAAVLVVSALLAIPFLALAPTESASTEPGGPVFDARDRIDDRFVSSVHPVLLVIEDEEGNLLRTEPLRQLLAAQDRLAADPVIGPVLFEYFEVETQRVVVGVETIADLIDAELAGALAAGSATDDDVQVAAAALIERLGVRSDALALSAETTRTDDGQWIVPAISPAVLTDNDQLGFGNVSVNLGGDTDVEEFDRDVQEVIRTADGLQVNGVAIDVNLTSQEQGAVAGPFIGFTILAVLLIVGVTFRSYWVLAVVSAALLLLIIWLKGISNLIGLKDDLVLSLIVPVAMVSFGVDFAFHAIGRYREERAAGRRGPAAYVTGMAAVSGALVLALTSDGVAFLSNMSSGIESINQFGLGAAIALGAAYLLLGVAAPLVIATIEDRVPAPAPGRASTVARATGSIAAAAMAMASVLLLVFVLPWLGLVLTVITILATLVVPVVIRSRATTTGADDTVGAAEVSHRGSSAATTVGRVVAGIARHPRVVIPLAVGLSAVAAVFAVRVPAEFDVEDFFSSDTDFVVGLDQLDTHIGDRGGEPALLYVEGELEDPATLAIVADAIGETRTVDTDTLATTDDGSVRVDRGIFSVFDAVWASPAAVAQVESLTGIVPVDADGNGIPDTSEQITAVLTASSLAGVPFDAERLALTPDDVVTSVSLGVDGEPDATVFEYGVVDSRAQESVAEARAALSPIAERLEADLGGDDEAFVQVTGSPLVREASLDATNRALQVSLPIALLLCLIVATTFLRSLRYGLASIVPIIMVVAWLYAFMEIAGYAINIVTATIAAVSIGIGIDFAIHFIARYREELERTGRRQTAVEIAAEGTGTALVASAFSSAIGFGILAFAPMPLFAAYGLLTALMIMMALVATLAVLPSLLVLVTRDRPARIEGEEHDDVAPSPATLRHDLVAT